MLKTVPFQTIKFSMNTLCTSIQSIDRILSDATTPSYNGFGRDGNEG